MRTCGCVRFRRSEPSTASDDRGPKLDCYKLMSSVHAVLLVAQNRRDLRLHMRQSDGSWSQSAHETGAVQLESVQCMLPLDEVYQQRPDA
jgi:hypothetical protein